MDPQPIIDVVQKYQPDLIALIETNEILIKLLESRTSYYHVHPVTNKKSSMFLLYKNVHKIPMLVQEYKKRMNIYRYSYENEEMHIIVIHFPSKIFLDEKNQLSEAIDYYQEIEKFEKSTNNRNSLIVGDFNMNPFDQGMIAGNSFNSVSSEEIALEGTRTLMRKKYEYFYNPSWKLFGSNTNIFGTYFLKNPDHSSFHWNIYDQALLRSTMLQKYKIDYSAIYDDVLFNKNGNCFSDHSPVHIQLLRR